MSGGEHGAAGGGDLLGDQLEGARLAGAGGPRDQTVAVEESQRYGDLDLGVRLSRVNEGPSEPHRGALEAVARGHVVVERAHAGTTTSLRPAVPAIWRSQAAGASANGTASMGMSTSRAPRTTAAVNSP